MRTLIRSIIFAVIFLFGYSFGPGQSTVQPVRVSIATDAREDGDRFDSLVRRELNTFRNVVITERKPDYAVFITATELTEGGKRFGYAAAILVVVEGAQSNRYRLSVITGPTLERVARCAVEHADSEYFARRR